MQLFGVDICADTVGRIKQGRGERVSTLTKKDDRVRSRGESIRTDALASVSEG